MTEWASAEYCDPTGSAVDTALFHPGAIKMNGFTLPKECKIERVAATKTSRYAVCGVKIDAERKSLIATDGRILLELPVADMNGETTAVVPAETFKALRRHSEGRLHCDGTHAIVTATASAAGNGDRVGRGSEERFAVLEGSFPNPAVVLDAAPDAGSADVILGINAALLARLAQGMGTDDVVLRIRTDGKLVKTALSVTPLKDDDAPVLDARGVIMPISVKS